MTKAKQTTPREQAMTDKERLQQAYDIHASVHHWMGYMICDGKEDLRTFRKWVLMRERKTIKSTREATAKEIIDDFVKMCGDDETLWSDEIDQLRKKYHAVVRDKRIVQENDKELE